MEVALVNAPGYRCSRCGAQTLDGGLIDAVLAKLAETMTTASERLSGDELRFLRKHLGLTQQELADRTGINRVTIADWERGDQPASLTQELRLRALVLERLGLEAELHRVDETLRRAAAEHVYSSETHAAVERGLKAVAQARSLLALVRESERASRPTSARPRTFDVELLSA